MPSSSLGVEEGGGGCEEEDQYSDDGDCEEGEVEGDPSDAGFLPSWSSAVVVAHYSGFGEYFSDRFSSKSGQR